MSGIMLKKNLQQIEFRTLVNLALYLRLQFGSHSEDYGSDSDASARAKVVPTIYSRVEVTVSGF
eukprot:779081-Amphidinium_carterae.1